MKRITKAHVDECKECQGIGYTRATSPELSQQIGADGKSRLVTLKRGSGCPRCLGTGRIQR